MLLCVVCDKWKNGEGGKGVREIGTRDGEEGEGIIIMSHVKYRMLIVRINSNIRILHF